MRDVEDMLAERGVIISYESVRVWYQRFGTQIAAKIRRECPVPAGKWHLDEVVISIRGRKHWLWRAVDANGDVLKILLQSRRNAHAAKRFLIAMGCATRPRDGQTAQPEVNCRRTASRLCAVKVATVRAGGLHVDHLDARHSGGGFGEGSIGI
ncbi:DDE domain protein [Pseudosulfitobacter pseudonitzschiae]|uniref:DDE domain protein n=1 Tax=Pseudosulfitobacter pseudonitzschiae TaxID=1402135 RepID=A0A221K396_9RHOB|nr:DDE domain protein [Pseudosulfitobacter pseudonitzschiae]